MNTMVSCTSASVPVPEPEKSRSRRCSTETVFSIQDQETDLLRDTSDTENCDSDDGRYIEFEPVTEPDDAGLVDGDSSGNSDNEIISTKVIEILVGDDGDLELADSEQTASEDSDSEMDFHDYWKCAQCRNENNNPLYRYCEKCFKERKNFFPPRPKRKLKLDTRIDTETISRTSSQDSGVEIATSSQEFSQEASQDVVDGPSHPPDRESTVNDVILSRNRKRRAESADRRNKRIKVDYSGTETDTETDQPVKPLVKMTSDPAITVAPDINKPETDLNKLDIDKTCIICCSEPKSGVFVHGRIAHICCCYKCARQVWATAKRCPVCNCKVSNVLRAVVM